MDLKNLPFQILNYFNDDLNMWSLENFPPAMSAIQKKKCSISVDLVGFDIWILNKDPLNETK